MNDTEMRLAYWRDGATQAERLAAAALTLSGFEEIDPQSPVGGPDGKKDIICRRGGVSWVGAVYFPTAPVRFPAVKAKFKHDLEGVTPGHRGFAFVTNQSLSPGQRKSLTDLADAKGKEAFIVHLERLRTLLDAPSGYGTRIQFLRIPMSVEEQLSWFSESGNQVAAAVTANTRELLAIKAMVERLSSDQKDIRRTLRLVASPGPLPLATPDLLSTSTFARSDKLDPISAELSASLVLLFHRLICFDLPARSVGRLRTREATLAAADGSVADHVQPAPAREVLTQLEGLCESWQIAFRELRSAPVETRLSAMASFHARFLVIHPFVDGNGRTARAILMQQCLDLFDRADMSLMDKGAVYYRALAAADAGNLQPLVKLLSPIVEG